MRAGHRAYLPETRAEEDKGLGQDLGPLSSQTTPPTPPEEMVIPAALSSLTNPLIPVISPPPRSSHISKSAWPPFSASVLPLCLFLWETQQGRRGRQGSALSPSPGLPPGLPKAARISHLKVLQCQGFYQLCGAHQEDVIYLALPLYHMSGSLLGIVGCLGIGQSPLANPHVVL